MARKTPSQPEYVVLILSYRRSDNVRTYSTLRRSGYTGPIRIVVGTDDPTIADYEARYPGEVVTFDKQDYVASTDAFDNRTDRGTVLYARNACPDIVRALGFSRWVELDDDYHSFMWRSKGHEYKTKIIENLDAVFAAVWEMYEATPWDMLALAQGGDFLGGSICRDNFIPPKRKVMNSFFCSLERHHSFIGRLNDDVNTYVAHGNRGRLFLTIRYASLIQEGTQQSGGGLTDMYKLFGTYVKSFYTVMVCPSCVKVKPMQATNTRWHHAIAWNKAVPKIVRESLRKP